MTDLSKYSYMCVPLIKKPCIHSVQNDVILLHRKGRKLSQIGEKYDFRRENYRRLLALTAPKDAMLPNFAEKTFASTHETAKICESFLP